MASKNLFSNKGNSNKFSTKVVRKVDTVNLAGGTAYKLSDKAALAQYAMTGCLNGTYYASDKDQLKNLLSMAAKADTEFLAKLAVYSRQEGLMKDMPAVLAAIVAGRDSATLEKIFTRVVDNPKMARNFIQIIRSGATSRKSLGTRPKKLMQAYFAGLNDEQLFRANIGNDPSLSDMIKLVHPKPSGSTRNALYAYLLGKEHSFSLLPQLVQEFEVFKKALDSEMPNVPFQMLTALPLTKEHWKQIAHNATWNQIRMNLNTFARHGVFEDEGLTSYLAKKLADPEQVKRAKVFPYQLFTSYLNIDNTVPKKLSIALQQAAEIAVENVPTIEGQVYVMVDVSGSMGSPVTGYRGSVSSAMRCVDVAALIASSILRKNPETVVMPFDTRVHNHCLNPMDSIMTNANILRKFGGGGTHCALPLAQLNTQKAKGDAVIYVSDNESWIESANAAASSYSWSYSYYRQNSTATMAEWQKFKGRNPKAKLACIDLTPNRTTQAHDRPDILNVGGFTDQVFSVVSNFMEMGNDHGLWVKTIESVKL